MEELKKKLEKAMESQFVAIEKLKKYGKKTISKTDLESVFAVSLEEELFEIISILSEQQILTPIKSSKTNGNRLYPIYSKYKVSLPQETYETELKEINALHIIKIILRQIKLETSSKDSRMSMFADIWCLTSRKRCGRIRLKHERMFELCFVRVYIR